MEKVGERSNNAAEGESQGASRKEARPTETVRGYNL